MQRPEHGMDDVGPAVGSGSWWDRDERSGDTTVQGCGMGATMSTAARRAWPHHRCSMTSTPDKTMDADAADHCMAPWNDNGPQFSQGRTRFNPISWGDLAQ